MGVDLYLCKLSLPRRGTFGGAGTGSFVGVGAGTFGGVGTETLGGGGAFGKGLGGGTLEAGGGIVGNHTLMSSSIFLSRISSYEVIELRPLGDSREDNTRA